MFWKRVTEMTEREEFFSRLDAAMQGFPVTEANRAVEYYTEYWDDALEAGKSAAEICEGLETPEVIAKRVRSEVAFDRADSNPSLRNVGKILIVVLLAIFAAPVAFPVAVAAVVCLIVMLLVVVCLAVALVAMVVASVGAGIALVVSGVPTIVSLPLIGLWMLGGGLALTGIGLLLGLGCAALIRLLMRLCGRGVRSLHDRVTRKPDPAATSEELSG